MTEKNVFTNSFAEWQREITRTYPANQPDKIIFPPEVQEYASGYITYPVINVNGSVRMVVSYETSSMKDGFEYFKNLSKEFSVFPYQVLWRHIQVDDYTLNSYIFSFITMEKE